MAGYIYFTGNYKKYYNELNGISIQDKTTALVSQFSSLVQEFNTVNSIMNVWTGEAASVMSSENIAQLQQKFQEIGISIENNLAPAATAMEELIPLLEEMKTKEEIKMGKEEELAYEKSRNVPETIASGKKEDGTTRYITNPEYNSWKSKISNLQSEISLLIQELETIKGQCDTKIALINSLESALNSFAQYGNAILGQDEIDFANMTLEERLACIDSIIANYQKVSDFLSNYLKGKYGESLNELIISSDDFRELDFMFDAFDIYWKSGVDRKDLVKSNGTNAVLSIDKLLTVINYCENNAVFTKIESYINGASWEASGLSSLYEDQLFNAYNENKFKDRLKQNYGITDVRNHLKNNLLGIKNSYFNLLNSYGEYRQLMEQKSFIDTKIEQLNHSKELMPYEMYMENSNFLDYLNNDYLNYEGLSREYLKYMNQQEVALYDYLLKNKSKEFADNYLKAMEDAINQRIGYSKAQEYALWLLQDGFQAVDVANSGFEGIKDGVRGWWDGILDLGRVDSTIAGTKSAFDYEQMFKTQLVSQLAQQYGITDNECSWINDFYQTGSSVGNMLVPMLASFVPVVGQGLSSGLMFFSITGNSAVEAKQMGATTAQAYVYGCLSGASELATEKLLGGIPGISKLKNFHIGNKALNGVTNFIANGFSEGLEEFTQTYIDEGLNHFILGQEWSDGKELFNEAIESGKQGVITSYALQGINGGINKTLDIATTTASQTFGSGTYDSTMQNSFARFKNDIESRFASPDLENILNKMATGEELSLIDKGRANNILWDASAEDISNITQNMTFEQQNNIFNNGDIHLKAKNNVNLANTLNNIKNNPTSPIMEVSGVDTKTLHKEVTSDGRTLSEYLIDNSKNPQSVIDSVKNNGGIESSLTASKMEARLESNIKEQAKYQASVEKTIDSSQGKIEKYSTKLAQGESLTIFEKTDLNNAVKKVSISELSDITSNLSTEQRNSLNNNNLSSTTMARVNASSVLQNAQNNGVIPTDARTLQRNVSRDGRSMAEYLVDTNPTAITESVINEVSRTNPTLATNMQTRLEENSKIINSLGTSQVILDGRQSGVIENGTEVRVDYTVPSLETSVRDSQTMDTTSPAGMALGALGITGIASGLSGVQQNIGQNIINASQRTTGSVSTTTTTNVSQQTSDVTSTTNTETRTETLVNERTNNVETLQETTFDAQESSTDGLSVLNYQTDATNTIELTKENAKQISDSVLEGKIGLEEVLKRADTKTIRSILDEMLPNDIARAITTYENQITEQISSLSQEEKVKAIFEQGRVVRNLMSTLDVKTRIKVIFSQGMEAASGKYRDFFKNFREHAEEHTKLVRDYAVDLAKKAGTLNVDEVYYGSYFHDLGMRGGVYKTTNGKYEPIDSMTTDEAYAIQSKNKVLKNKSFEYVKADTARGNHPLNSAIAILTEEIVPPGIDREVVALLAMSHSKSTSGIKDFSNPNMWIECIDKLGEALKAVDPNAKFDADRLKRIINEDQVAFERLQAEALCIRDGDAMSKVALTETGDTIMQTGGYSEVTSKSGEERTKITEEMSPEEKQKAYDSKIEYSGIQEETVFFEDKLYTENGQEIEEVDDWFSKKVHAGELNVDFESKYDPTSKKYIAITRPLDANQYPCSTFSAIEERLGEVLTYGNCTTRDAEGNILTDGREFLIVLPAEAKGTEIGSYYEYALKDYKEKNTKPDKEPTMQQKSFLRSIAGQEGTTGKIRIVYADGYSINNTAITLDGEVTTRLFFK